MDIKRRTVIVGIGAGVGGLIVGSGATLLIRAPSKSPSPKPVEDLARNRPVQDPGPEVKALFGELTNGSQIGPYTVTAIYPLTLGAIPVVMEHDGKRFQVDVLRRNDEGAKPVGETPSLALFLVNKGNGCSPTDQVPGLGAMALAAALASREKQGARAPALLSLEERIAKYPQGNYAVG